MPTHRETDLSIVLPLLEFDLLGSFEVWGYSDRDRRGSFHKRRLLMFSLRMLLALVTLSAVYIAGMVYRTEWWTASLLTLTYLIFAAALSAAILSHQRRAFFVAFIAFGLGYGACIYSPMGDGMITGTVLSRLADRVARPVGELPEDSQDGQQSDGEITRYLNGSAAPFDNPFDDSSDPFRPVDRGWWYFVHIGHAFVAILISCIAGTVAESLVRMKSHAVSRA
jgi:hypothetical protein